LLAKRRFIRYPTGLMKPGNSYDRSRQLRPISGVVGKVIRSLGMSRNYDGWIVVSRWPEIVGPVIAEQAHARRYADGVLIVSVPDDSWRQELAMQTEEIMRKIQALPFGRSVKKIRLERG